jgi:CheY-like chemotaxis protein
MRLRHILVVEDSDEDFETVQDAALQGACVHPVVRASSGHECMQMLRLCRDSQRSREVLPLLVLLDLNLPGDDGRDVLRQVRGDEMLCTLPLVVLSASSNPRDLQFCYANGANAYHVKPVIYAAHLKVLQDIFGYWLGSAMLPG